MKNCLLPHTVTYYKKTADGFSRRVLSPVRLCTSYKRDEMQNSTVGKATLYVFPSELAGDVPTFEARGDYFLCGKATSALLPKDGSAFLVTAVTLYDAPGQMRFYKLEGLSNRGDCDE